jgi:GntR family transcriptional regulator
MTEPERPTRQTATRESTTGRSRDDAPHDTTPPEPGQLATQRRRRPVPRGAIWQQIAADLREQIETGQLAPDEAIPSETQLMARYDVARPTVRQAVGALRASGLLVVQRGRATTVRSAVTALTFDPTITRDASGFRTWDAQDWEDVEDPSCYRTDIGPLSADLDCAPGEPVFVMERQLVHTSRAEIMYRLYVPFATAADVPALETNPFRAPADLYQVLTDAGHALHWRDATTTAMPSPDEAVTLLIPDGVPLLIHTRITLNADQRPLALEVTHLPGDRTTIVSHSSAAT